MFRVSDRQVDVHLEGRIYTIWQPAGEELWRVTVAAAVLPRAGVEHPSARYASAGEGIAAVLGGDLDGEI